MRGAFDGPGCPPRSVCETLVMQEESEDPRRLGDMKRQRGHWAGRGSSDLWGGIPQSGELPRERAQEVCMQVPASLAEPPSWAETPRPGKKAQPGSCEPNNQQRPFGSPEASPRQSRDPRKPR